MKRFINFFEIPSKNYEKAAKFYAEVLDIEFELCDCGDEKMAICKPDESGLSFAISQVDGFNPSADGLMIHFDTPDLDAAIKKAKAAGGKIKREKTEISGDHGHFALISDLDGNTIGLHMKKK